MHRVAAASIRRLRFRSTSSLCSRVTGAGRLDRPRSEACRARATRTATWAGSQKRPPTACRAPERAPRVDLVGCTRSSVGIGLGHCRWRPSHSRLSQSARQRRQPDTGQRQDSIARGRDAVHRRTAPICHGEAAAAMARWQRPLPSAARQPLRPHPVSPGPVLLRRDDQGPGGVMPAFESRLAKRTAGTSSTTCAISSPNPTR